MGKVWTKKPPVGTQIDLQHPMAKDLIFFCALDRAGNQIDLIHTREGVRDINGAATAQLVVTSGGLAQDFEISNASEWNGFNFGNTGGSGYYEPDALTIIARVRPENEFASAGSRVISKRTSAGGNDDYTIYLSDQTQWRFRINGLEDIIVRSAGDYLGVLCDLALAVDSGGQDSYVWEVETGDRSSAIDQTGATVTGDTGNLCIGFRDVESRQFDGLIYYVAMWSIKKDQQFIEAFRQNPWQIFKPKPRFALVAPQHELIQAEKVFVPHGSFRQPDYDANRNRLEVILGDDFDGSDQPFTVAFWLRRDSINENFANVVAFANIGDTATVLAIQTLGGGDDLRIWTSSGGFTTVSGVLLANTWQYVIARVDLEGAGNNKELYFYDKVGNLLDSATLVGAFAEAADMRRLKIGGITDFNEGWRGNIRDLKIWNGWPPLNAVEKEQFTYEAQTDIGQLAAWYPLDAKYKLSSPDSRFPSLTVAGTWTSVPPSELKPLNVVSKTNLQVLKDIVGPPIAIVERPW